MKAGIYKNITASGVVKNGPGKLRGMYVNSTSSGTVKLYDNTAASGTVIHNTITPAVGWHWFGDEAFVTGVYATIAGTIDVTFVTA